MSLPDSGRVLGVDAGFSKRRATTGFCGLEWDSARVNWTCANARSDGGSRLDALRRAGATSAAGVLAAAIDGPLRPGLEEDGTRYRAAEALLSCGCFQKRGKPGQTHAGSGPRLHAEATSLARFVLESCRVVKAESPLAIHSAAVVEAFPNMFLGVLCDEQAYPPRPERKRKWTDSLYCILKDKLRCLVMELLPGRTLAGSFDLQDHEHIAGFVCALTALAAVSGRSVAVGSHQDGFIILPPFEFWGAANGCPEPWAARELRRSMVNAGGAGKRFPTACVYRGRERWLSA